MYCRFPTSNLRPGKLLLAVFSAGLLSLPQDHVNDHCRASRVTVCQNARDFMDIPHTNILETVTERRLTERRMTGGGKTERRMTERRMTESRR